MEEVAETNTDDDPTTALAHATNESPPPTTDSIDSTNQVNPDETDSLEPEAVNFERTFIALVIVLLEAE